jgi:hypothetical protein
MRTTLLNRLYDAGPPDWLMGLAHLLLHGHRRDNCRTCADEMR